MDIAKLKGCVLSKLGDSHILWLLSGVISRRYEWYIGFTIKNDEIYWLGSKGLNMVYNMARPPPLKLLNFQ